MESISQAESKPAQGESPAQILAFRQRIAERLAVRETILFPNRPEFRGNAMPLARGGPRAKLVSDERQSILLIGVLRVVAPGLAEKFAQEASAAWAPGGLRRVLENWSAALQGSKLASKTDLIVGNDLLRLKVKGPKDEISRARLVEEKGNIVLVMNAQTTGQPSKGRVKVIVIPVQAGKKEEALNEARAGAFLFVNEGLKRDLAEALDRKDFKQALVLAATLQQHFEECGIRMSGPAGAKMADTEDLLRQSWEQIDAQKQRRNELSMT